MKPFLFAGVYMLLAAYVPFAAKEAAIGSAEMAQDGTITLFLKAEGDQGEAGDALIAYPKNSAEYDGILKHLGGLKPGEHKPVPPWPQQ